MRMKAVRRANKWRLSAVKDGGTPAKCDPPYSSFIQM